MNLLLAFLIGVGFGATAVYVIIRLLLRTLERSPRRGGMIDLTGTHVERRQVVPPAPPRGRGAELRLVSDDGTVDVIVPLDREG